jgi:DNA-binding CsgD family transcriptional regulator
LSSNDEESRWSEQPGKSLVGKDQWTKILEALEISEREGEVCRLLFEGLTREEIATKMDIKVRTVRHYLERLHTKLRVNNRVALVLRIVQVRDAIKRNSLDDPESNPPESPPSESD